MAYSEFTFDRLEQQFDLILQDQVELFESIQPVTPSSLLQAVLAENIPLALEIDTEKARSEMIVAPILIELRKQFNRQIALFSGTEFDVDRAKGLNGRCDFLISHSPLQVGVTAPVAILVEAKNDNIKSGIPQCLAAMIGAQLFNEQKNNAISHIYGGVTTGSLWKFLKLVGKTAFIEASEHFVGDVASILGILSFAIAETRPIVVNK